MTTESVSTVEAGERLGIETRQVWRLIREGELSYVKIRRGVVHVTTESLDDFEARWREGRRGA